MPLLSIWHCCSSTSPRSDPPLGRLLLGSQQTGSRMTWVLVSSTTEATRSLLYWTEGKLAFTFNPTQSNSLRTNAWSDLKLPLLNVTSSFPLKRGYQRLLVSLYKAMKKNPLVSNKQPAAHHWLGSLKMCRFLLFLVLIANQSRSECNLGVIKASIL